MKKYFTSISIKCVLLLTIFFSATLYTTAQTNIAPFAIASATGTGAAGCQTGPCSTLNDLNFGTCGTQQMWINTATPPSTIPGDDWIQFDFPTVRSFNEIIIHHANNASNHARFLSGALIQNWNGTSWVNHSSFTGLSPACISNIPIPKLTTSRFRITSFELIGPGQMSNPNFREIEIISAPSGPNDATTMSLDAPLAFCPGNEDVYVTIGNLGTNQIDSVEVHWEINGIPQPMFHYKQLLDTINGTSPNSASVLIGTANMVGGNNTFKVWTSMPNGVIDTINNNDTLSVTLFSPASPTGVDFSNATLSSIDVFVHGVMGTIDYEYGPLGFTPGTGTSGSSTTNPFTISGLATSGPNFELFVRSICGSNDTSNWAGPFSFQTLTYSVSTFPTLNPNNGQSGISFNVGANLDLKVVEIENTFNTGSIPYTIWYSTDSINGPPNISTANNWIQHQSGTVVGNNTSPISIQLTNPIDIPAGETYGFFIEAGTRYHTNTTTSPTVFTDGNLYINTGNNVGYGGGPPNPTFHIRQFVGTVIYELSPKGPNNAGIESVDSLSAFCAGQQDVYTTIINSGINQIDSVEIHWEINGLPQASVSYKQLLDTANGTGPNTATILLGNATFIVGNNSVKIYTSLPNGVQDTLNKNDTLEVNLQTASPPTSLTVSNITTTSADIDVNGAAGNIEYEYGTTGFTVGTGTMGSSPTSPFTLTGLLPSTTYDIYVRSNCGGGDVSTWVGPFTFLTPCTTFNVPFEENFDNTTTPQCWTETGITPWNYGTNAAYGAAVAGDHTGNNGNYAWMDGSFNTTGEVSSLITPNIDVNSLTTPMLNYWVFSNNTNDAALNKLNIDLYDGAAWQSIDSVEQNLGPNWVERYVDLSPYTITGPIQIRFTVTGSNVGIPQYNDILLDDIMVIEAPTCFKPVNLSSASITLTTATLSWTEVNSATDWEIEYGPTGFPQGSGTKVLVNINPYTVTGLTPSTVYDFYVRSACGRNDTSFWAGPHSFSTANGIPYSQDFENFGSNLSGINNIEGWNNSAASAPEWESGTSTSSTATGPTQDHTIGAGGTFMYLETSGGVQGDFDELTSPPIYVDSAYTTITLDFWYHMHGASMGSLEVYIIANSVPTLVTTITGQQQTNQNDPWLQYTTNLTGYQGMSVELMFKGIRGTSFTGDMAIDDVLLTSSLVGVDEKTMGHHNVSISPNPSKGVFNLIGHNVEDNLEVSVYNTNGQIVHQLDRKVTNDFNQQIDLSGLAKGIYFVRLQGESSIEIKKVIVQ